MGFVPVDGSEVQQLPIDGPPVNDEWDNLIHESDTTIGGRYNYVEVIVRSDYSLPHINTAQSEVDHWPDNHAAFLSNNSVSEIFVSETRVGYHPVVRLAGNSVADEAHQVKRELIEHLETNHNQSVNGADFDIVWTPYQFEGQWIGIMEVVASAEKHEAIETAMLLLTPCTPTPSIQQTAPYQIFSPERFNPADQQTRALEAQKQYLLQHNILVIDGLRYQLNGCFPHSALP